MELKRGGPGTLAFSDKCDLWERFLRRENAVLDHCHKHGGNRGYLCNTCNSGLGMFRDSPEVLRKAIAYLERSALLVMEPRILMPRHPLLSSKPWQVKGVDSHAESDIPPRIPVNTSSP
jgi:hypothetical protein